MNVDEFIQTVLLKEDKDRNRHIGRYLKSTWRNRKTGEEEYFESCYPIIQMTDEYDYVSAEEPRPLYFVLFGDGSSTDQASLVLYGSPSRAFNRLVTTPDGKDASFRMVEFYPCDGRWRFVEDELYNIRVALGSLMFQHRHDFPREMELWRLSYSCVHYPSLYPNIMSLILIPHGVKDDKDAWSNLGYHPASVHLSDEEKHTLLNLQFDCYAISIPADLQERINRYVEAHGLVTDNTAIRHQE